MWGSSSSPLAGGVSLLLYIGLVALRRGHAHVDDGHIRSVLLDRRDECLAVADLGQDRPAGLLDQPGDAFPDERRVLDLRVTIRPCVSSSPCTGGRA